MTKEEKVLVLKLAIVVEMKLERVKEDYITEEIKDLISELKAIANK